MLQHLSRNDQAHYRQLKKRMFEINRKRRERDDCESPVQAQLSSDLENGSGLLKDNLEKDVENFEKDVEGSSATEQPLAPGTIDEEDLRHTLMNRYKKASALLLTNDKCPNTEGTTLFCEQATLLCSDNSHRSALVNDVSLSEPPDFSNISEGVNSLIRSIRRQSDKTASIALVEENTQNNSSKDCFSSDSDNSSSSDSSSSSSSLLEQSNHGLDEPAQLAAPSKTVAHDSVGNDFEINVNGDIASNTSDSSTDDNSSDTDVDTHSPETTSTLINSATLPGEHALLIIDPDVRNSTREEKSGHSNCSEIPETADYIDVVPSGTNINFRLDSLLENIRSVMNESNVSTNPSVSDDEEIELSTKCHVDANENNCFQIDDMNVTTSLTETFSKLLPTLDDDNCTVVSPNMPEEKSQSDQEFQQKFSNSVEQPIQSVENNSGKMDEEITKSITVNQNDHVETGNLNKYSPCSPIYSQIQEKFHGNVTPVDRYLSSSGDDPHSTIHTSQSSSFNTPVPSSVDTPVPSSIDTPVPSPIDTPVASSIVRTSNCTTSAVSNTVITATKAIPRTLTSKSDRTPESGHLPISFHSPPRPLDSKPAEEKNRALAILKKYENMFINRQ